ncbi:polysaccharide biosynthesis protein [Paeniglutamicibacter sp. ZC-3]|uniref:polysaccharide biosynthesis protein n=1 Tax=Paeniglutamicibacter sp. ZC-3 TaxID=2986919 RepID=UPI0021F7BBB7|nr:nucleoside-diphosphate sugar epimerase/dehydratase [Paeniglutamicibacter sp. ZC-3]MCV9996518.1 polysaccharide biosynthesis protein [Paeniglutamicibacter sp. ZC-3]
MDSDAAHASGTNVSDAPRWKPPKSNSRWIRDQHIAIDLAAWVAALLLATIFRFELRMTEINVGPVLLVALGAASLHLVLGWLLAVYAGRYSYGTFEEIRVLVYAMALVGSIVSMVLFAFGTDWDVPRSIGLIGAPIALMFMCGVRYVQRIASEQQLRPGDAALPTIIYGAGYLGETLVRRMLTDVNTTYRPVALIDDDPAKSNFQIRGVQVMGSLDSLAEVAAKTGAVELVVAINYVDAPQVRLISDTAAEAGLNVMVLPPLNDVLAGKTKLSDLRDLSIEDLIGRHPVDTEIESIAGYLAGKRVLVTGAGGSIGTELCLQISKFAPSELIMLDRDETGLQGAQIRIAGHGLLHTRDVVLADIRDTEALQTIFEERRPDVVFHAAALKHLPMLEQYPDEAWKTNVLGTLNVLRAAQSTNVATFVNISTDKAANPTSVLGHSKRMAEKLTAWMAIETGKPYLSVRFGNVIGSRGSMLPTFRSLIEAGGPLTVTHPDITRYFMTIPEACQLVVQAGGIGRAGEVLILDMGEPVKILDVAQRMIEMSGKDIEIVFTGMREGEKLHEELVGYGEADSRPFHPQISHADVSSMSPTLLTKAAWETRLRRAYSTDMRDRTDVN